MCACVCVPVCVCVCVCVHVCVCVGVCVCVCVRVCVCTVCITKCDELQWVIGNHFWLVYAVGVRCKQSQSLAHYIF